MATGDYLIMSGKERKRNVILEEIKKGSISLKYAAQNMEVCYRLGKK